MVRNRIIRVFASLYGVDIVVSCARALALCVMCNRAHATTTTPPRCVRERDNTRVRVLLIELVLLGRHRAIAGSVMGMCGRD